MTKSINKFLRTLLSILLLSGAVSALYAAESVSAPAQGSTPQTVRIMTVVIIQQEEFLPWLLEPYLKGRGIRIEYTKGHHVEVAAAASQGAADLVIAHTKVVSLRVMADQGLLNPGRPVFANPMAFLGPAGDPAGIRGLSDPVQAMRRIQEQGYCYVINRQNRLGVLQRQLLGEVGKGKPCIIDDATATNRRALEIAQTNGAYTMWGLHPALEKGARMLEPVVIPDARLLSELSGYVVKGGKLEVTAAALLDYLTSAEAQRRLTEFRFRDYPDIQPWWPAGR